MHHTQQQQPTTPPTLLSQQQTPNNNSTGKQKGRSGSHNEYTSLSLFIDSHLGHDLGALLPRVVVDGGAIGLVAVAHHHDVVPAAERVGVDGLGVQDNLRVLAGGLAGGRAVEVPLRPGKKSVWRTTKKHIHTRAHTQHTHGKKNGRQLDEGAL